MQANQCICIMVEKYPRETHMFQSTKVWKILVLGDK